MAHRITRRHRPCSRAGCIPIIADVVQTISTMAGHSVVALRRRRDGERGHRSPGSTARPPAWWCRRPISSATCAILPPIATAAHEGGALLIAVVTEAVSLGLAQPHRARWAPISSWPRANRSAMRSISAAPISAFSPREDKYSARCPAGCCGQTVGCRRTSRLRADPFDPRAAHPPRQGDSQYLHQFGPVRAGLHHPYDAAAAKKGCASSPVSTMPTR